MLIKILKGSAKLTLTGVIAGYLTLYNADSINKFINNIKYSFTEEEVGFVKKDQALEIKIIYEKNGKNNLETYLKNYNQKMPIYSRENGLLIGDSEFNFSNFTYTEKLSLCSSFNKKEEDGLKNKQESKQKQGIDSETENKKKLTKLLYELYTSLNEIK